jgi:hypothetical protein
MPGKWAKLHLMQHSPKSEITTPQAMQDASAAEFPALIDAKPQVRAVCEHGIAAGESMLHLILLHLKAARCSYYNVKTAATREDAPGGQSPR